MGEPFDDIFGFGKAIVGVAKSVTDIFTWEPQGYPPCHHHVRRVATRAFPFTERITVHTRMDGKFTIRALKPDDPGPLDPPPMA